MENKCNNCFYALMDRDTEAPCLTCTGYSNFVKGDLYMTTHKTKPLQEAVDGWFGKDNGMPAEDLLYDPFMYDTVSKPKHYMLFKEQGIEVRDVLEKLVYKIKMSTDKNVPDWEMVPMFDSDYVQMMQYLMRFMDKNGVEDLRKAKWYLDKLIEAYDDAESNI
jgi:hypothetical protein